MGMNNSIQQSPQKNNTSDISKTDKKKILIVYFSKTGHNGTIAQKIQNQLEDKYYITLSELHSDTGNKRMSFLMAICPCACRGPMKHYKMEPVVDVNDFDMVILCCPTWWQKPVPVATGFLEKNLRALFTKQVIFCVTAGGADPYKQGVMAQLEKTLGVSPFYHLGISLKEWNSLDTKINDLVSFTVDQFKN